MKKNLAQIATKRKTGNEDFLHNGKSAPMNLLHFWQWAGSDLINNKRLGSNLYPLMKPIIVNEKAS